ncbi:MAG: 4a-hydroxytetrahydrobiopterin dehydratase [Chloroflexi bacterium]|nr:4a-hydroxytetrahydrobiopterin dehydratase [Chloroflexota bacterium]
MSKLRDLNCVTPRKDDKPLSDQVIQDLNLQVPEWIVIQAEGIKRLQREFIFDDYRQASEFSFKVGELAEEQDHHPTIFTEWGKVTVTWWTHFNNGLHQNDFITAAKSDHIYEELNK